jgi:hypothetical protein
MLEAGNAVADEIRGRHRVRQPAIVADVLSVGLSVWARGRRALAILSPRIMRASGAYCALRIQARGLNVVRLANGNQIFVSRIFPQVVSFWTLGQIVVIY